MYPNAINGRGATPTSSVKTRRRWAVLAGLLLLLATGMAGPASAAPLVDEAGATPSSLYLPRPTGQHSVGFRTLYMKDTSRPDPWVPEVKARELMVSLWYPARPSQGPRPQYMTLKEAELLLARANVDYPPVLLSNMRTNSVQDAKPAGRRLPLIVLSPGFIQPRMVMTSLAEDLASRGYVVAAIDHTYESVATSFPDGRTATCKACEVDDKPGFWEKLADTRAKDVSFVLDELTGKHPKSSGTHSKWNGVGLVDKFRIAMAGHSAGGGVATTTILRDSRIRAGVDLDGRTYVPIPASGLSRPFLFFGQESHRPGEPDGPGSPLGSWERDWPNLTGWKRWIVMAGAEHASFHDLAVIADQLGIDFGAKITGARSVGITRAYVAAFFDLHLRHKKTSLFDGPSPRYPEVKFCSVETKSCA